MNWLDETVAWLSPAAGIRRAQARAALALIRGYEGAKNTRRTEGWAAAGTSANAEIAPSISSLRNRCRQMVRDNPHASRALAALVAKRVGTGIQARVPEQVRDQWKHFCRTCDVEGDLALNGIQFLAASTEAEGGEAILRRVRTRDPKNPLKLQLLEGDYIDSAKFERVGDDNFIIAGVEINRLGQKQALWLYDQHPGEVSSMSNLRGYDMSRRVPMSELIHFYEKKRPGQLRGVPKFASSIMRARDLDDYRDALLLKKKIEACFAVFRVGGTPGLPLGEQKTDSSTGKRIETLSPGMIYDVPNGTDVKFANPSSTGGESEFTKDELHAIAAGTGVTYEQMTGDLQGVSFSGGRLGEINLREIVDAWRWVHFEPGFLEKIYLWWEDAYWTAGLIRTTGYDHTWTAPRWEYANPKQDVEALKEEIRGGLKSLPAGIRELGEDPDQVLEETIEYQAKLKAAAVVVDTDAAHKAAPAAVAPASEPSAEDKAKEKEKEDAERAADSALLQVATELLTTRP